MPLRGGLLSQSTCLPSHRPYDRTSGHGDGTGALARCYYSGRGVPKDDALSRSLASSSAESGSAYGQYVLGAMHFNGDCGFEANDASAAALWELAGKQGHAASADWLSVLCVIPCPIPLHLLPSTPLPRTVITRGGACRRT